MNCSYIRAENIDKKISSRGASDVSEMIELILSALDRYRYSTGTVKHYCIGSTDEARTRDMGADTDDIPPAVHSCRHIDIHPTSRAARSPRIAIFNIRSCTQA